MYKRQGSRFKREKGRHPALANFFLDQSNKELDKKLTGFAAKASEVLLSYHWPGSLRQMKNIIKRATLLAQGSYITLAELRSTCSKAMK